MQMAERKLLLDHFIISRCHTKNPGAAAPAEAIDDMKISYLSDERSKRRIKRASRGSTDQDLKLSMSETWAVLRHGTEKIFTSKGDEGWDQNMTDAQLDAFLDTCLMDSGSESLPQMHAVQNKYANEEVERELNGGSLWSSGDDRSVPAIASRGASTGSGPPPEPFTGHGVRTIFDLQTVQGNCDEEEEVCLNEGADCADNSDDAPSGDVGKGADSITYESDVRTTVSTTTVTEPRAERVQGQEESGTASSAQCLQDAEDGDDPDAAGDGSGAEDYTGRFPKRQRIAAQR